MPWLIVPSEEQFCLHKQNADGTPGERVSCHATEAEAADHLAALYTQVDDIHKTAGSWRVSINGREVPDTAIKSLNEDGSRIGGYLVIWGSPAQRDLQGEYFTPETELGLDWYDQRPVLYHHGLDGALKASVVGVIDTLKADAVGLWAEAQLDLRQRYVQAVRKLVERGILGWSSGSLPQLVEVTDDGRIKRWPIVEGSLTPSPAEPRRTDVRMLKAIEGFESIINLEELSAKAALVTADPPPAPVLPALIPDPASSTPTNEVKTTMKPEDIIRAVLEAVMAAGVQLTEEQQAQVVQQALAAVQGDQRTSAMMAAPIEPAKFGEIAKAVAPKVKAALDAILLADEQTQTALTEAAKAAAAGLNGQGGQSRAPGFQSGQGARGQQGKPTPILLRTKYHNLSAADMAFLYQLRNPKGERGWNPDQKWWRELADKAGKALDTHDLDYLPQADERDDDEPGRAVTSAVKAINAIKADEVDYSTQTGYGDEWVPDLWRSELWLRARRDNIVAQQFQIWDMPTNPWNIPLEAGDPTVYRVAETKDENQFTLADANSPIPDSKFGTDKNQLTAYKLALRVPVSAELEEDSIVQAVPQAREQALRALQDAIDYVILNADNTVAVSPSGNINKYDAAVAATDKDKWLLGWEGVLHLPLVDSPSTLTLDAGNAKPTLQMFRSVQSLLDEEYLDDADNLVWFVDALTHQAMKGIAEFLTVDKFGPKATVLTGQVGAIDGVPVLSTNQLKRGDVTGKISNTAANNNRGRAALVYKPYFAVGYRRQVKTWVKFYEEYDAYQLGATVRIAFKKRDTTGTPAGLLFNIAV